VFYPRYYEWMDACSHTFFDTIGLNLGELLHKRQLTFGLTETSCRYFKPGRYRQDIKIVTGIVSISKKTIRLQHAFSERASGHQMLEGMEERICISTENREIIKAVDIPEDIHSVFQSTLSG